MFPGGHYGQQLLFKIFYVLKLCPHWITNAGVSTNARCQKGAPQEEYPG